MRTGPFFSFFTALVLIFVLTSGALYAAAQNSGNIKQSQKIEQVEVKKNFIERFIGSAVDSVAGVIAAVRDYVLGRPERQRLDKGQDEQVALSKVNQAAQKVAGSHVCGDGEDCSIDAQVEVATEKKVAKASGGREALSPQITASEVLPPSQNAKEPSSVKPAVGLGQGVSIGGVSVAPSLVKESVVSNGANAKKAEQKAEVSAVKQSPAKNDAFSLSKVAIEDKEETSIEAEPQTSGVVMVPSAQTSSRAQISGAQNLIQSEARGSLTSAGQAAQPTAQTSQPVVTVPVYVAGGLSRDSSAIASRETLADTKIRTATGSTTTVAEVPTRTTASTDTERDGTLKIEDSAIAESRLAAQRIQIEPEERGVPESPVIAPAVEAEAECVGEFSKVIRGEINNVKIVDDRFAIVLSNEGGLDIKTSVDLCSGVAVTCRFGVESFGCAAEVTKVRVVTDAEAVSHLHALPEKMFFIYDRRAWVTSAEQKLVGKVVTENLLREGRVLIASEFYKVSKVAAAAGDIVKAEECLDCRVEFSLKDSNAVELSGLMRGAGFDRILNPPIRYGSVQLANGVARGVVSLDAMVTATDPESGVTEKIEREFFVLYQ